MEANRDLARRIDRLEAKYNEQFKGVFDAIKQLIREEIRPKREIGFHAADKESALKNPEPERKRL